MEKQQKLPAIQINADDLSVDQQREHYKKEVEKYEAELQKGFKAFKRDASRFALVLGTAYVAYRVTRYLLKDQDRPKTPTPPSTPAPAPPPPNYAQNGHIPEEKKTPPPKKTFSIMSLVKRQLTTMAVNILKEKLQEEILKFNKKDAK